LRALERAGFEIDHQTGSHIVLWRAGENRRVVVPSMRVFDHHLFPDQVHTVR